MGLAFILQSIFPQVVLMSSALVSYRSQISSGHSVASFLLKTFEILEKAQFSHIISWAYEDDTFAIKNILQFTNEVLPKYFRHRNFSSFVRQLNMYDFHKIKQSNDYIVFRNPMFRRGEGHLLKKIRRKAPKKNQVEKKASSTIGINRLQENANLRMCFQSSIHQSTLIFEKSLLSLEAVFPAFQKKEQVHSFTTLGSPGASKTALILDRLTEIQKLSNLSFKSIGNINLCVDECLKQKLSKYSQVQFSGNAMGMANNESVESGCSSSSSDQLAVKSECSIGDKKEPY